MKRLIALSALFLSVQSFALDAVNVRVDKKSKEYANVKITAGEDSLSVGVCSNEGVQITLSEQVVTTISNVINDSPTLFTVTSMENSRGVYVTVTDKVKASGGAKSTLRLVRRDDDKTYLINLSSEDCSKTNSSFAKVISISPPTSSVSVKESGKINAILDNEVLVANKGSSQKVRVKLLENVYSPTEPSKVIVPKGSIGTTNSTSFNEKTGLMKLNFNKVKTPEGKEVSAKFSTEMRGEIRDTSKTLGLNLSKALINMSGTSDDEVEEKINNIYKEKMPPADLIYWAPKGTSVILQ